MAEIQTYFYYLANRLNGLSMPLTPFHWSIVIFGFLAFSYFYIPALAISSVIMDLEPFYYLFIQNPPDWEYHHRFFHTYLGASLIALIVGFVLVKFRKHVDLLASIFKIEQNKITEKMIYLSSFFGAYSHIFIDSFMHVDIRPFWPFDFNPFLGLVGIFEIYLITGIGLTLVGLIYMLRIFQK